jgi:two-component system sensor histidine kinase KdpD
MSEAPTARAAHPWRPWLGAVVVCAAATAIAVPLGQVLDNASLVLLFLLAVVLCGAWFGRGPAVLAAGLSVLLFNLVFVPPRLSFAVADERLFFTLAVMLLVGLIVGHLTASLRAQAAAASEGERLVRQLYDVSRELGKALTVQQVDEIARRFLRAQLAADACLWTRSPRFERVSPGDAGDAAGALAPHAAAAIADEQPAGTAAPGTLVIPLRATMAIRGALALLRPATPPWSEAERRLIDASAALVASALERIHYIEVARASAVDIEGERLRNTLLAAISHDLRTPLASLVGLAESLALTRPAPTAQQSDIARAIAASARRMSALVGNLLDMARVESGALRLRLDWLPVEEVFGTALAACEPALAQHRVEVHVPNDMPLLRLDAALMERVLVNLLENAAKYTPPGSTITLAAGDDADGPWLSVSDDGPGFRTGRPQDLLLKFERGTRESATPGVGLGLALCQAIVTAHGGQLRLGAGAGGGARIAMHFARSAPPDVPDETGHPPESD